MTWEYLQTEELDLRLKIIAAYLKGKTKDRVIVDLDCGTARLIKFLEKNFKLYYGNDVNEELIEIARGYGIKNSEFVVLPDNRVTEKINEIDILLMLGYGAGEYVRNDVESETLADSFKNLVAKFSPKIVIVEGIDLWERNYKAYSQIKKFLKEKGYLLDYETYLQIGDVPDEVYRRRIFFFQKIS